MIVRNKRAWISFMLFTVLIGLLAVRPLVTTLAAASAVNQSAFLQVAHLAPFAADASVNIELNGMPVPALTDFDYGDSTAYLELEAGEYDIAVIPTGAADPAIEATVTLLADTYYTAIAVGDGVNQSLDLLLLEDDITAPEAGMFHLRLGHLAPFASGEDVLADVRLQDGTPILENVNFGVVDNYVSLAAGTYDLIITTPGGETPLIDPEPVNFAAGMIVSAFATGDGSNQDLGVFALPADAVGFFLDLTPYSYLQVAHLAPFAVDASVTIALNGAPVLEDFNYGDSTGYLPLPSGDYDIAVTPTGATDPAIEATVTLVADMYYTAVAVGDGLNVPLDLLLLEDDVTEPAEGMFRLRIGHLAPFATGADLLADVRLQDGSPILENVNFGQVTEGVTLLELPAGWYDLMITAPGGDPVLIDPIKERFAAGMIVSVFATGDGENQELAVYVLPAGEPGYFLPDEYVIRFPLIIVGELPGFETTE